MSFRLLAALLAVAALIVPVPAAAETATGSPAIPATPWTLPLAGSPAMTRAFQAPPHPYGAGHRGVDLAAAGGAPVLAAMDGVVVFAGMVAGRPVISIDHAGGLRTTYEPVAATVGAGQAVARGSTIGRLAIGHAGCPVRACLHWGLRRGETYLDPLALVRPPRIRLLPISR